MDIPNDTYQQYSKMDDTDETEDTLSFCDLPIHSNPADLESFYQRSSSLSSSDQDYFEFFSEEFTTTSTASGTTSGEPDTILFCGKLIPYKQQQQQLVSKTNENLSSKRRGILVRWRSGAKSNGSADLKFSGSNSKRWYLFMFGLARVPVEMELSDMRRRQSRRVPAVVTRSDGGGEKVGVNTNRGKGLWGLIRYLGCGGGRQANAVVKASFGCMPRV